MDHNPRNSRADDAKPLVAVEMTDLQIRVAATIWVTSEWRRKGIEGDAKQLGKAVDREAAKLEHAVKVLAAAGMKVVSTGRH